MAEAQSMIYRHYSVHPENNLRRYHAETDNNMTLCYYIL